MKKVRSLLKSQGFFGADIMDEYSDHYISHYEALIDEGIENNSALLQVQQSITMLNGRSLSIDYYITKYKNVTIMITLLLSTVFYLLMPLDQQAEPPSISPVALDLHITSGFGERMHPFKKVLMFHKGMDIKGNLGDAVIAPSDGTVVECGYDDQVGHYIVIQHDEIYSTRYHHLSKRSVEQDQRVAKGDKIAEIGSSGVSTGPHLHYEVLVRGKHVDPSTFLGA